MYSCDLIKNFNDGDFLYGRNQLRHEFIKILRSKVSQTCVICKKEQEEQQAFIAAMSKFKPYIPTLLPHPLTIDDYNNPLIESLVKIKLSDGEWPKDMPPIDPNTHPHNPNLFVPYYTQIFLSAIPQYVKPLKQTQLQAENLTNALLAKSCKANCYNPVPEIKIHFITDFEMISAALGFTHNLDHFKAFTAKEIRFIYKHWLDLTQKIIFYDTAGMCISPPWEDTNSAYYSYWPKLRNGNTKNLFGQEFPLAKQPAPASPPRFARPTLLSTPPKKIVSQVPSTPRSSDRKKTIPFNLSSESLPPIIRQVDENFLITQSPARRRKLI